MFAAAALAGLLAGAGLIIAIGSQNAFVLRQGLRREHVALVVATCIFGDVSLILAGVAGMGGIVRRWPLLLEVLRYGGALFLASYGALAARRAWQGNGGLAASGDAVAGWKTVLASCLAFTFLNPHVYLDTMILLGSLSTRYPGNVRWAFAAGACLASIAWFTTLGFGARLLAPLFQRPRAWRVLDTLVAAFMFSLAAALLLHPLH